MTISLFFVCLWCSFACGFLVAWDLSRRHTRARLIAARLAAERDRAFASADRTEAARLYREGRRDVEIAAEVRQTAIGEVTVFARRLIHLGAFDVTAEGPPVHAGAHGERGELS